MIEWHWDCECVLPSTHRQMHPFRVAHEMAYLCVCVCVCVCVYAPENLYIALQQLKY